MRRRELDGCPISRALQMIGDKWTLLVVRDLAQGPKRTMELLAGLAPISSRTLVARLRDMEKDKLVERTDLGGSPPHIEYELTERGRLLISIADVFRQLGETLDCGDCETRRDRVGEYCGLCPKSEDYFPPDNSGDLDFNRQPSVNRYQRRERDDSIVLL